MKTLGWDTETHLIGPQRIAPPVVCLSSSPDDTGDGDGVWTKMDGDQWAATVAEVLADDDTIRIAHNNSFDCAVLVADDFSRITRIFDLLVSGRMHCTMIREKLLNLTKFGGIDAIPANGSVFEDDWVKVKYHLSSLVQQYFGVELSGKEGDDVWRLNYAELEDIRVTDWPDDAIEYALDDSIWARRVWEAQEARRNEVIEEYGIDPFETLNFRCTADFCLHLMSCWGMATDSEEIGKVMDMLANALSYDNMPHLIETGILRPAQPSRPYANGATNADGSPKMTAPKKESVDTKKLHACIQKVCKENNIRVRMTDPSKKFPKGQVSAAAEFLDDLSPFSDVLNEYRERQKLQKLVTTELPRMMWEGEPAPIVHPCFDVLKRSGRTSSFARDTYPSFNCQNVDPRVRNCYVPREGTLLFSVDYNQMELGTFAQKCLDLFGYSVMADKINAGYDLHAYLAAQLARRIDGKDLGNDPDEAYANFLALKKSDPDYFKHWRKFAKPTGLGYPGGLGAETFVAYAKATYGVIVDVETAGKLREVWKDTFPESYDFFEYINEELEDPKHSGDDWDEKRYFYKTPYGMLRPNADYCAAANGIALQSPSAEGALTGLIAVTRACYDPSMGSILGPDEQGMTTRPICFIHDEIVGEVRDDDKAHERVEEIKDLMVEAMMNVTPDVVSRAEGALMHRWDKRAEPVYDDSGKLIPWTPKDEGDE